MPACEATRSCFAFVRQREASLWHAFGIEKQVNSDWMIKQQLIEKAVAVGERPMMPKSGSVANAERQIGILVNAGGAIWLR